MGNIVVSIDDKHYDINDPSNIGGLLAYKVMHRGQKAIIENTDDDYHESLDIIRKALLDDVKYTYIQTTVGKMWTNPYYFHLSGINKYALQVYEGDKQTVYSRVSIVEAIKHLSKNDIILNEYLHDIYNIGSIPEYIKLKNELISDE